MSSSPTRSGSLPPTPPCRASSGATSRELSVAPFLEARYEIIANKPSRSFTALIAGSLDRSTGLAVLNGTVTAGWLAGQPVHVEFRVISCTQAADGTCFTGTIRVIGDSETDNED